MPLKKIINLIIPWTIWVLTCLIYFHQYYLRVSVSGLTTPLHHDFFLSAVNLADLSAIFFLSYIIFLPFSGILIDIFGPKKTIPLAAIVTGVACLLFAHSQDFNTLVAARLLMGGSASFALIGAFVVIKKYFAQELFPILSGLTLSIGLCGALLGSGPLVLLASIESWRYIMSIAGIVAVIIAVIIYVIIEHQHSTSPPKNKLKLLLLDYKKIIKNPRSWLPGIYGGIMLSPIIAFASFWAGPFLSVHLQISFDRAENLASLIFVGYVIGAPIIALLAERFGIKKIMVITAIISSFATFAIIKMHLPQPVLMFLLILQGMTVGSFVLTAIAVEAISPPEILASSLSFNTLVGQIVGSGVLLSIGKLIYLIDKVEIHQKAHNYYPYVLTHTMYILLATLIIGIFVAAAVKIPKSQNRD